MNKHSGPLRCSAGEEGGGGGGNGCNCLCNCTKVVCVEGVVLCSCELDLGWGSILLPTRFPRRKHTGVLGFGCTGLFGLIFRD